MNNKDLLIDFIEYAKSKQAIAIFHSNIEPLVDSYLNKEDLKNRNIDNLKICIHTYKAVYISVGYVRQCTKCGIIKQ